MIEKELTFLVVLDDSKEIFNALRYAAKRTARNIHLKLLSSVIGRQWKILQK